MKKQINKTSAKINTSQPRVTVWTRNEGCLCGCYHPWWTSMQAHLKLSRFSPFVRKSAHCSWVSTFTMATVPSRTRCRKKCHFAWRYFVRLVMCWFTARRKAPLLSSKTWLLIVDVNKVFGSLSPQTIFGALSRGTIASALQSGEQSIRPWGWTRKSHFLGGETSTR